MSLHTQEADEDEHDEEAEEESKDRNRRQSMLLLNDDTDDSHMLDLMKKSTELFGARKSVSQLFMLRRSTTRFKKEEETKE